MLWDGERLTCHVVRFLDGAAVALTPSLVGFGYSLTWRAIIQMSKYQLQTQNHFPCLYVFCDWIPLQYLPEHLFLLGNFHLVSTLILHAISDSDSELMKADGILAVKFGESRLVAISITAVYLPLPMVQGVIKCDQNVPLDHCQALCRIDMIQNLCNCTAVSWPPSIASLSNKSKEPYCSFEIYR